LKDSPTIKDRIAKSRSVIVDKVEGNKSVYGVSTGFGGSGMLFFSKEKPALR
jgi:phenylalanine ammonia-lyase